ncbi:udp-glucuronosyl udp-glucosyltransferase [Colletotrichum sojae]|uniref:Udp-glucuronosyl udp-glucosyltransferase n=1 Tax=Colletotrichum sojae TaxID=2175907 RepID=A0A8H6IQY0_9PEZI|nr:udp-glucuronosyl udp-glucosyltransferase [Colletotrichum sojae]
MTATTAEGVSASKSKPLLLITAFPGEGHTNPLINIASYLAKNGYEVVFMAPEPFRGKIEATGAEYLHIDNPMNNEVFQAFRDAALLPKGPERVAAQYVAVFFVMQPARTQNTENALAMLRARDPDREIIFMEDVFNSSFWAFRHGRPLPAGFTTLPKAIGFGVAPLLIESQDTGPMSLGLLPDSTESGRKRNKIIHELVEKGPMKILIDEWHDAMRRCGCTDIPSGPFFKACYAAYDAVLQLCSPSLEYQLSDLPSKIEFVGVLPRKVIKPDFQYPTWWPAVETTQEQNYRYVVFVSQGTLNPDYSELIFPALKAFADREDILVVITLGVHDAKLPPDVDIPPNARVIDYMPYDAILKYTDVFVSNAGYGTYTHAVSNGVPVLLAGENEEKIEVTMRAVYAGVGLSLETQTPTSEQVRKGVEQILQDNKYKKAAMKLKMENDDMNALANIEAKIRQLSQ